jgi:hypothetical protein
MASRTVKFTEWMKLVARHAHEDCLAKLTGTPVADTADKLKVTPARVYQLIEAGILDTLVVVTKAGKVSVTLVTLESVERYLAERVPDVRGRQGMFSWPDEKTA